MPENNTLSKSERLCSERRMETLFAQGRRGGVGPLRFVWVVAEAVGTPTADFSATVATATADFSATQNVGEVEAGVSVLFSVPKKFFKRAWKRNLIKRRMRESYRTRKHDLLDAVRAAGQRIDIALICSPQGAKGAAKGSKSAAAGARNVSAAPEIPDFKTLDDAIGKILAKILERR